MGPQLLDIQPRELRFLFELKKQSSCSIRLVNKSHNHVAFKVKTTSPKKYCVRPNVGIIMPKSSCEFTVTMQAQRSAPPDMSCKDKFLIQSTIVAAGTSDEDITSAMFFKEEGKYVEENKLRVSLISPPDSPVPSPTNGKVEYENNGAPFFKDGSIEDDFVLHEPMVYPGKLVNSIEVVKGDRSPEKLHEIKVVKSMESSVKDAIKLEKDYVISSPKDARNKLENKLVKGDRSPEKLHEIKVVKSAESPDEDAIKLEKDDVTSSLKDVRNKPENKLLKFAEEVRLKPYTNDVREDDNVEGANLIRVVQQMKLKISELESKLRQTESTISTLSADSRRLQRQQILKQDPELLMSFRTGTRSSKTDGFPMLFVIMVALLSLIFGYLLR